jgi:uncharacterized protein
VGALGGLWGIPYGSGEPIDQHADDLRSATFIGPVLTEPILLLGRPEVVVTGAAGRVVVKLTDVDPDGRSRLISGGLAGGGAGVGPAWTVQLEPAAYRVPAGHRLRVVVSGGSFPRVWPAGSPVDAAAVWLALPVVPEPYGTPASVPGPAPRDAAAEWRWHEPRWEIRQRPGRGLSLRLGESFAARLPRAGVELESRISTTSTVRSDGSAELQGESLTIATLGTGERAVVAVELRLTPGTVRLCGSVTIDGHTIADRRWSA